MMEPFLQWMGMTTAGAARIDVAIGRTYGTIVVDGPRERSPTVIDCQWPYDRERRTPWIRDRTRP